jgi:hemoglobin-like flavoprotein
MLMLKDVILKAKQESLAIEEAHPEVLGAYKARYEEVSKECGVDKAQDTMALMIKQYFEETPDLDEIFDNDKV